LGTLLHDIIESPVIFFFFYFSNPPPAPRLPQKSPAFDSLPFSFHLFFVVRDSRFFGLRPPSWVLRLVSPNHSPKNPMFPLLMIWSPPLPLWNSSWVRSHRSNSLFPPRLLPVSPFMKWHSFFRYSASEFLFSRNVA